MNVTDFPINGNRNNGTEYSPLFIADFRSFQLNVPIVNFQPPAGDGYKYKLSPRSELLSFLQRHHPLLKHTFLHHIHLHHLDSSSAQPYIRWTNPHSPHTIPHLPTNIINRDASHENGHHKVPPSPPLRTDPRRWRCSKVQT